MSLKCHYQGLLIVLAPHNAVLGVPSFYLLIWEDANDNDRLNSPSSYCQLLGGGCAGNMKSKGKGMKDVTKMNANTITKCYPHPE